nr:4,5-DOPA dioxygenase extradiol [Bacteroidota bacterium]
MNRKNFLKSLTMLPIAGSITSLESLAKAADSFAKSESMPVLFVGHGSPMNAIEDNRFSREMKTIGKRMGKPSAILMISAHWETKGSFVTIQEKPQTIHDFGGFPQALFEAQYPAPGSTWLAGETQKAVASNQIAFDGKWGFDHGCWSVAMNMFPLADVPIVQLSLDYTQTASQHYALAQQLKTLRNKGVLIIGSGNMIHNLGMLSLKGNSFDEPYGYDWAMELNSKLKQDIENKNHQSLINYTSFGKAASLAIPTPEHYLPMLYTLAMQNEKDSLEFFNDSVVAGSISMTSFVFSS